MCNVDADPAPPKPLRNGDRRPAPAERIENDIALVAAGLDDALQQRLRLLGGVAEAFALVTSRLIGRYVRHQMMS